MSDDPLKDLLLADTNGAVPARDLSFVTDVMKRAAQRRLIEGLAWVALSFVCVTAVLFALMPRLTPVLTSIAPAFQPVAIVLTIVGLVFVALDQGQRYVKAYGFGL